MAFSAPKIGDGEQIGDGNTAETLNVGRSGQPVAVQSSAAGTLGFYGATPAAPTIAPSSCWSSYATPMGLVFGMSITPRDEQPSAAGSRSTRTGRQYDTASGRC